MQDTDLRDVDFPDMDFPDMVRLGSAPQGAPAEGPMVAVGAGAAAKSGSGRLTRSIINTHGWHEKSASRFSLFPQVSPAQS